MAFTYSNPSTDSRSAVRLLAGDTDPTDYFLEDGEIDYFLTLKGTHQLAAAAACRAIAAKLARRVSQSVGGVAIQLQQQHAQYLAMAQEYETQGDQAPVAPWSSGWRKGDKQTVEQDTDREQTFSRKGIHDNPGAGDDIPWSASGWDY